MLIFRKFSKTYSDQNIHQKALTAPHFPNFLVELAYAPETPSTTIINMYFCMKIAIFYSRLFQNLHRNVPIVNVFKKFLHKNYPKVCI